MSNKGLLYAALALIAIIGMIPVMGKIGATIGQVPLPTAIDVPSAMKHIDSTYASSSAETKTATPSNLHY